MSGVSGAEREVIAVILGLKIVPVFFFQKQRKYIAGDSLRVNTSEREIGQ